MLLVKMPVNNHFPVLVVMDSVSNIQQKLIVNTSFMKKMQRWKQRLNQRFELLCVTYGDVKVVPIPKKEQHDVKHWNGRRIQAIE